ncbi:putative phospholipid import ATP-binding protein MlaF [Poriferisphaera corsica]|uniref:Putative phospholipid import ATP-binding protein MlaF n=1 Tax=Poriferisphaera corsica TaxID=2528020 RepID=A0A517YW61_9BACT|nr:ABC transporter ATP-binding protein [Poriferisphaera corsica]QDU34474.1 putative phospholipid import ATP-binding protein MlaF [Poriferisphaera corsica]
MTDNPTPPNQGAGSQHPLSKPPAITHNSDTHVARLHGVSKRFGPLRVLHRINLEFERGKTTVILGPSGTGKSVMLKHIVGLLRPDQGEVFFNDVRVDHANEQQLVEMRKKIGFLFQMGALFDSMNVGQNIAFPLVEHTTLTKPQQNARVAQVLKQVGLSGLEQKMPAQLSGGQRKRVALARAVVLEPELILYDEPTTGLDPIRADVINELIIALNKELGISSIVVTHDMQSANKVADRMLLLYNGSIVCDGTPEQFRKSDNELVQRFIKGIADEQDLDSIRSGFDKDTDGNPAAHPDNKQEDQSSD